MKKLFRIAVITLIASCSADLPTTSTTGSSTLTCAGLAGADFTQIGEQDDKLICLDKKCESLEGGCNYNDGVTTIDGLTVKYELTTSTSNVKYYKAEYSSETGLEGIACFHEGAEVAHKATVSLRRWNSNTAPCEEKIFEGICNNGLIQVIDLEDGFDFEQACSDPNGVCAGKDAGVVVDAAGNVLTAEMKTSFLKELVADLTAPNEANPNNDCELEANKSFPNGSLECLGEDRSQEIMGAFTACKEVIIIKDNLDQVDLSQEAETKLDVALELLKDNENIEYHTKEQLQVKISEVNKAGDAVDNSGITLVGTETIINASMVQENRISDQRVLTLYFTLENMGENNDLRQSSVAELEIKLPAKADTNEDMIKKVSVTLAKDQEILKFKISEGHQLNEKWEDVRFELVADSLMSNDVKNSDNSIKADYTLSELVDDADNNNLSLTRPEDNDVLTYSMVTAQFKVYGVDKTDPNNMDESLIGENLVEVRVENKSCGEIDHGDKIKDSQEKFYSFQNSYATCDDIAQLAIVTCHNSREVTKSQDDSIYKFDKCNSWDQDLSTHEILATNSASTEALNVSDAAQGDEAIAIKDLLSFVKVESDNSNILADFYDQLTNMEIKLTKLATSWGSPSSDQISEYATIVKNGNKFEVKVNTLKLKEELGEEMTKSGAFNLELSITYENMDGDMVDLAEVLKVNSGLTFSQE